MRKRSKISTQVIEPNKRTGHVHVQVVLNPRYELHRAIIRDLDDKLLNDSTLSLSQIVRDMLVENIGTTPRHVTDYNAAVLGAIDELSEKLDRQFADLVEMLDGYGVDFAPAVKAIENKDTRTPTEQRLINAFAAQVQGDS